MFFAQLLDLLGYTDDEHVAVCWQRAGQPLEYVVLPPKPAAVAVMSTASTSNVWFGVNPTAGPARNSGGRGDADAVTRMAALFADLDVKPGGCPDMATAHAIIDDLSGMLGTRPSAIVMSGHGLQPYWPIEDGHTWPVLTAAIAHGLAHPESWHARVSALLRRWGRLVKLVAAARGAKVDNVYDLARILRVPGTVNNKSHPVPVTYEADNGAPLTVEQVDEVLDEAGIYASDVTEHSKEILSAPNGWNYTDKPCQYVKTMVAGWNVDQPAARHPWLISQAVRIAAAHRNGCLTRDTHSEAHSALSARFATLRAATNEKPGAYEIANAHSFAAERVACMTDDQLAAELGNHLHLEKMGARADPFEQRAVNNVIPITAHATAAAPQPAPAEQPTGFVLRMPAADSIADDVPVWAWSYGDKGRIQLGTLALFAGRPGAGKSNAARWFAAKATQGDLYGIWHGQPQNVAYIAPAEESVRYIIKPGLRAAGADLTRIYFPVLEQDGKEVCILSQRDEDLLAETFTQHGVKVVIVDPLMSSISANVDIHRNNETRAFVEPWARLADRIDGIVLGVCHLKKNTSGDLVAAINGSSAFGEVARAVFGFTKDPESDEGDRIMSQAKNSTGFEDLSLTYQIVSRQVVVDSGMVADVAAFKITGESDVSAQEVLNSDGTADAGARKEAEDWLHDYLLTEGPQPSKDVKAAAKREGHSERTLKRAVSRLKVEVESRGFPRVTWWAMPGTSHLQSGQQ